MAKILSIFHIFIKMDIQYYYITPITIKNYS